MPLSVIGAEFDQVWQEKEKQDKERADRGMTYNMASYRFGNTEDTSIGQIEGNPMAAEATNLHTKPVNLGRYYLLDEYIKICDSFTDLHTIVDAQNKNMQDLHLNELARVTADIRVW